MLRILQPSQGCCLPALLAAQAVEVEIEHAPREQGTYQCRLMVPIIKFCLPSPKC